MIGVELPQPVPGLQYPVAPTEWKRNEIKINNKNVKPHVRTVRGTGRSPWKPSSRTTGTRIVSQYSSSPPRDANTNASTSPRDVLKPSFCARAVALPRRPGVVTALYPPLRCRGPPRPSCRGRDLRASCRVRKEKRSRSPAVRCAFLLPPPPVTYCFRALDWNRQSVLVSDHQNVMSSAYRTRFRPSYKRSDRRRTANKGRGTGPDRYPLVE